MINVYLVYFFHLMNLCKCNYATFAKRPLYVNEKNQQVVAEVDVYKTMMLQFHPLPLLKVSIK